MKVMDIAAKLQVARVDAGLSASDVGRIAGVPASTITRIEKGSAASLPVLSKVLDALGMTIDLSVTSRPSAILAARVILGEDIDGPSDMDYWIQRWDRAGWLDAQGQSVTDLEAILSDAGKMASLRSRPGIANVEYRISLTDTSKLFREAGVDYAITGDYAGGRYTDYVTESWPVLYVDDIEAAVDALGVARLPEGRWGRRISLLPFDGASEVGRMTDDAGLYRGMTFAAPWQVLMDNYAGAGRMPLRAEKILRTWEAQNA